MLVLRNQTISVFDISKKKNTVLFSKYGCEDRPLPLYVPTDRTRLSVLQPELQKVKKSHFNYMFKGDPYSVLWNTASDACVLLDSEEAKLYEAFDDDSVCSDFSLLLYELGMLVDFDLDEVFRIDLLRKRHAYSYPDNRQIDVEILPTQNCNARCFYCFEQKFTSISMDDETADRVVQYLCSRIDPEQTVNFIWFGGEPLLGERIIDRILHGVNDFFHGKLNYTSSITTNNSLLSPGTLEKFQGLWNVKDVLTTLDGFQQEHNIRKAYVGQPFDAYSRTLQNLERLVRTGIKTTCRINLDKENIMQLDAILKDLQQFSDHPNFGVQVTTLRNKTETCGAREKYYAAEEYPSFYSEVIPKLFHYGFVKDPLSQLPVRDSTNCLSCALNKVVINANGKLFRCVQDSLADDNSVGDCVNGIRSNWNYSKWYSEIDDLGSMCENCVFLPNCQGGCKYYRLFPSFDTTPCFRKKFYIDYVLEQIVHYYSERFDKCLT